MSREQKTAKIYLFPQQKEIVSRCYILSGSLQRLQNEEVEFHFSMGDRSFKLCVSPEVLKMVNLATITPLDEVVAEVRFLACSPTEVQAILRWDRE